MLMLAHCKQDNNRQGTGNGIRFSAISYAKNEVLANANNLLTCLERTRIGIEIGVKKGGHKHVIKKCDLHITFYLWPKRKKELPCVWYAFWLDSGSSALTFCYELTEYWSRLYALCATLRYVTGIPPLPLIPHYLSVCLSVALSVCLFAGQARGICQF